MTRSNWKFWIALVAGVGGFVALGLLTNPLHDAIFFKHTSIQDGITTCSGVGELRDCVTEDGVRAYNNHAIALLGNAVSLILLGLRAGAGYFIFRLIHPKPPKPPNPFTAHLD